MNKKQIKQLTKLFDSLTMEQLVSDYVTVYAMLCEGEKRKVAVLAHDLILSELFERTL